MARRALVTGITGQDGSYLAELLLGKGYEVYGLVRRLSTPNISNIAPILDDVHLLDGDVMDQSSLNAAVKEAEPDEVYNLAAQSFVGTSFVQPVLTGEITGLGAVRTLDAVRAQRQTIFSEFFWIIGPSLALKSPRKRTVRMFPRRRRTCDRPRDSSSPYPF